jgi:two-component system, cell cycle sensor histidine kinase and response regulator CckA
LRDIHVTGTSFNGRCTVFPAGFFGCQLPVLRQHIHRNKSPSLEPYLQIVSENHWHRSGQAQRISSTSTTPEKTPLLFNLKTPHIPASVEARIAREQEFQFQQARNLKSMNMLARGVAHDFNNFLAGILSSAELIRMDSMPGNPGNEFLEQIFMAGERARAMINQLRDFSLRKPCERALIPLQPVMEECLRLLRSIIPDKVEFTHDIGPECPAVFADAAQIQQAVMQLCINAWHSLPERMGRIHVRLDECKINPDTVTAYPALRAGAQVRISIRDNGQGLRKDDLERIFEPFALKSSGGRNSGFELFTVQEIVNENDGVITAESAPGKGTEFHLYFPIPA